jgi:hypothetical protein
MIAILGIKRLLVVVLLLHPPTPHTCFIYFATFFLKNYALQVPFSGAAFFPGRLIHTNELMV